MELEFTAREWRLIRFSLWTMRATAMETATAAAQDKNGWFFTTPGATSQKFLDDARDIAALLEKIGDRGNA